MYGFAMPATVTAFEPQRLIVVDWGEPGAATQITWWFTARDDDTTFGSVENSGFAGSADERVAGAIGSTEGFTFVLASAKAWLEHGLRLNLVADRFPDWLWAGSRGFSIAEAECWLQVCVWVKSLPTKSSGSS